MDVIALVQAGFEHAVAPLGTAVTEEQLGLIWRMADEPVIALDGDRAGLEAAERLVDMALPMLAPGRSLGFCLMPEGQDPDDLIRAGGRAGDGGGARLRRAARGAALAARDGAGGARHARAARRARQAPEGRRSPGSPIRACATITRPSCAPAGRRCCGRPRRAPSAAVDRGVPRSGRADAVVHAARAVPLPKRWARISPAGAARDAARIRESAILLIALRNPQAIRSVEAPLEAMTCTVPEMQRIRDASARRAAPWRSESDIAGAVATRLGADPVAALEKVPQARAHPMARPGRDPDAVALVLQEAIHRHQSQLGHALELAEARRDLADAEDEAWTARLRQANIERITADSEAVASSAEASDNAEESVFQRMLDSELWRRRKKP